MNLDEKLSGSWERSKFKIDFDVDFRCWDKAINDWIGISFPGQALFYSQKSVNLHPYTGINDKSDNKIYHGDILRLDDDWAKITDSHRLHVLVGFHEGSFMYGRGPLPLHMNTFLYMAAKRCKIVGNFYEHASLLEETLIGDTVKC